MKSESPYYVCSFARGLQRMFCSFVIEGVSNAIGNMHEGKWTYVVIDKRIRIILCFMYTLIFAVSLEKDDNRRTKLRAINTPFAIQHLQHKPCR